VEHSLLTYLLVNISMLLLVAAILTELRPLRNLIKQRSRSIPNQILLGAIFGALSIINTYMGIQFQGAVVNTRVVSNLAAGLLGGPIPGLVAGIMGSLHRYLYDPNGLTSLACAIGTFLFGVIGGAAYRWLPKRKHQNLALAGLVVFAEGIQCLIILAMVKPFSAAVSLEVAILPPKMLSNSLGLVIFMNILGRLNRSLTIELAEQRYVALVIAQECLPYLRQGMSDRTAMRKAVDTVHESLPDSFVVMTDRTQVLAASGIDLAGDPLPAPAQQAMEQRQVVVIPSYSGADFNQVLRDRAAVAAPLVWDDQVVGALMRIVPLGPNLILEADQRTTEGLAQMFSSMLELGELQHQVELRQQAELRALQSQINPHFLFNALNTISGLCLTDPNRAREIMLNLAGYLRQTLTINESFVTLEQELSNVNNYLAIIQARFEDAIHVTWDLPDDRQALRLPPLILQPLVENAVRHGGTTVDNRCIHIQITQDDQRAYIRVSDKGHGFPPQVLEKLQDPNDPSYSGLFNVRKRLRSIYGNQCVFTVDSSDQGSTVAFSIPLTAPQPA
jgi:two-component system sensor histidine kinase LytS